MNKNNIHFPELQEADVEKYLNETGAPYFWCNDDTQKEWLTLAAGFFYNLGANRLAEQSASLPVIGKRSLKDITDEELLEVIKLTGMYGCSSFWGDITITCVDRLRYEHEILVDFEQFSKDDNEKAVRTLFFYVNEMSYFCSMRQPWDRTTERRTIFENAKLTMYLIAQGFNILGKMEYAPPSKQCYRTYLTTGYIVCEPHPGEDNIRNGKFFDCDHADEAMEYAEEEKEKGNRLRVYNLIENKKMDNIDREDYL